MVTVLAVGKVIKGKIIFTKARSLIGKAVN